MSNVIRNFEAADLDQALPAGTTLLEASAGTGKTYTIATLVLRLILEQGLEVREILVSTFTTAATAELRDRIRKRLQAADEAFATGETHGDDALQAMLAKHGFESQAMRKRIIRAVRDFDEAAIYTIHSFCQRALQECAFESGSAFEFELAPDETRLFTEIAEDFWRSCSYTAAPVISAALVEGRTSAESLRVLLQKRLQRPLAQIVVARSAQTIDEMGLKLASLWQQLQQVWSDEKDEIKRCFQEGDDWAIEALARKKVGDPLARVEQSLEAEGAAVDFTCISLFATSSLQRYVKAKKTAPHHLFFELCESLGEKVEQCVIATNVAFLEWAPGEIDRRKAQRKELAFGDLLAQVYRRLLDEGTDGRLRLALRGKYKAALIDEFQDTDAMQDRIFEILFSKAELPLFLIGDPKQAIYSFRSADVHTYLRASRRAEQRYTLGRNHRSDPRLVAAVNHLFSHSEAPFVMDEIVFRPAEAAKEQDELHAVSGAPLELWTLDQSEKINVKEAVELICEVVADECVRILQEESARDVLRWSASDIAILTRTNAQAAAIHVALANAGVPAVLQASRSVFETHDAHDFLILVDALVNCRQEGRIRAALLLPMFGFSAQDIAPGAESVELWETQLARFHGWSHLWMSKSFIDAFRHLLRDAGVRNRLFAIRGGSRSFTNLAHLAELLQEATAEKGLNPNAAMRWLEDRINGKGAHSETEHELRLDLDAEAVRITTLHKSKGLQYGIVFCPFATSPVREVEAPFFFHGAPPERLAMFEFGKSGSPESMAAALRELVAESVRELYVAVTRAKHRSILVLRRPSKSGKGSHLSPLAWLLHRPPGFESENMEVLNSHLKEMSDAEWLAGIDALVKNSEGVISSVPLPKPEELRLARKERRVLLEPARVLRAMIPSDWGVSSFSSLSEHQGGEAPDYDILRIPSEREESEASNELKIHDFPAGAKTGICFHEIMEELDFQDDSAIAPLVEKKLIAHGFDEKKWGSVVDACVRSIVSTPLPDGFALNEVPQKACLTEVEFYLPAHRLVSSELNALLENPEGARLEFEPKRGWLKGFIDLVFERGGRYYIADWKSNRLGLTSAAYSTERMEAEMAAHHYSLQLHLYATALHRYLRFRLPGYRYEEHFGGVYYVFMRGIDVAQPGQGIIVKRPSEEKISEMDHWMEGDAK